MVRSYTEHDALVWSKIYTLIMLEAFFSPTAVSKLKLYSKKKRAQRALSNYTIKATMFFFFYLFFLINTIKFYSLYYLLSCLAVWFAGSGRRGWRWLRAGPLAAAVASPSSPSFCTSTNVLLSRIFEEKSWRIFLW